ncbi:MAG: endolytic transglycosylase MltG [Lachnospiraceae bacterium]|nr:endolytic transglycosylase MltG [Lachnospiraceae bacterium]
MRLKHYLRGLGLGIIVSTLIVSAGKNGRAAELSNEEIKTRARELGMVEEDEMLLSEAKSLAEKAAKADDAEKEKQKEASVEDKNDENPEKRQSQSSDSAVSGNNMMVSAGSAKKGQAENDTMMAGSFLGAGAGSTDTYIKARNTTDQTEVKKEEPQKEKTVEVSPQREENPKTDVSEPEIKEEQQVVTVAELESRNSDAGRAAENTQKTQAPVSVTIVKGESSTAVAKKLQNAGVITDAAQFDSYLCLNGFDRKLVTGSHTIPAGASARDVAEIITGR